MTAPNSKSAAETFICPLCERWASKAGGAVPTHYSFGLAICTACASPCDRSPSFRDQVREKVNLCARYVILQRIADLVGLPLSDILDSEAAALLSPGMNAIQ
jgi:hypothetical protein